MRTRPLAALLLVLAGAGGAGAQEDRSARVFEALEVAAHARPGPHFNSRDLLTTSIAAQRVPEAGRRLFLPVLPPHCGTGMIYGGLEPAQAAALARRLFAAYGLELQAGHGLTVGGRRLPLDGLDPAARVGWTLLPPPLGDAAAPAEDGRGAVHDRLAAEGLRVLVVPLDRFRSMQADTLTPLLAFALSVVAFLNDVTEGADVDVEALATGRTATQDLPPLTAGDVPRATSFQVTDGNAFFVAEGRGTTMLAFGAFPGGRATGPGLLVLPCYWTPPPGEDGTYDFDTPPPRFVLLQGGVRVESESGVFLVPAGFQAGQPFRVRVDYVPGQVHLGGPVTLRLR